MRRAFLLVTTPKPNITPELPSICAQTAHECDVH